MQQIRLRLLAALKQTATNPNGYILAPEIAGLAVAGNELVDPDMFSSSIYRPIAVAADLAAFRFHDLRHFFASMLIAQSESPKYICDQLGHSSIQVTFDTYGHLFLQARREASAQLEKAMFADREKATGRALVEKAAENSSKGRSRSRAN